MSSARSGKDAGTAVEMVRLRSLLPLRKGYARRRRGGQRANSVTACTFECMGAGP